MLGIDPVVKVNISDNRTGGGSSARSIAPETVYSGGPNWDLLLDCYVSNRAVIFNQNLPVKENVLDLYKLI